jgi:hypothetical protein
MINDKRFEARHYSGSMGSFATAMCNSSQASGHQLRKFRAKVKAQEESSTEQAAGVLRSGNKAAGKAMLYPALSAKGLFKHSTSA